MFAVSNDKYSQKNGLNKVLTFGLYFALYYIKYIIILPKFTVAFGRHIPEILSGRFSPLINCFPHFNELRNWFSALRPFATQYTFFQAMSLSLLVLFIRAMASRLKINRKHATLHFEAYCASLRYCEHVLTIAFRQCIQPYRHFIVCCCPNHNLNPFN